MKNMFDEDVLKESNQERVTTAEKLAARDWSRDKIPVRMQEVRNNQDTIESIMQDLLEESRNVPSKEDLIDEWGSSLDQKNIDTDNIRPSDFTPHAFEESFERKYEKMERLAIWQARLTELQKLALDKVSTGFEEMLEEYRQTKTYDNMQDMIEDTVNKEFDKRMAEEKAFFKQARNDVERVMQKAHHQQMSLMETFELLSERSVSGLDVDEIDDVLENKLKEFMGPNGVFTIQQEKLDSLVEKDEVESLAKRSAEQMINSTFDSKDSEEENDEEPENYSDESDSESQNESDSKFLDQDGKYDLKNKDLDEKVDVLEVMYDDENLRERIDSGDVNKSEIAELTNISQPALFNQGLFEKIEDKLEVFYPTP